MNIQIETGLRTFIEAGIRTEHELAEEDPLPIVVLEASGEETVEETDSVIVAKLRKVPQMIGNLGMAEVAIILSSPLVRGQKTSHDVWANFLQRLFSPPIPPDLAPNAAHLSSHIFAATGAAISARGYHPGDFIQEEASGRWEAILELSIGLCRDSSDPLEPEGDIDLDPDDMIHVTTTDW